MNIILLQIRLSLKFQCIQCVYQMFFHISHQHKCVLTVNWSTEQEQDTAYFITRRWECVVNIFSIIKRAFGKGHDLTGFGKPQQMISCRTWLTHESTHQTFETILGSQTTLSRFYQRYLFYADRKMALKHYISIYCSLGVGEKVGYLSDFKRFGVIHAAMSKHGKQLRITHHHREPTRPASLNKALHSFNPYNRYHIFRTVWACFQITLVQLPLCHICHCEM